ncbi:hypothetical protein [Halobacteriovorax sp. HLS]|uniref:hypothetical protein n=1 Tax=Halobacteriovorax sp. HLS TaxID=2234000 RepID=UPI0013E3F5ED|nr:hypothetical protein [Halobacteriovorax sp. HLS]
MIKNFLENDIEINYKKLFIFSAFFHLIAVIFSEGFHRPDEHLGMLRYVFVKLNLYPIEELSWEYPAKIRNWVQPGIYYAIAKILNLIEIKNPFTIAFFLRLFTSIFSMYTLVKFSKFSRIFFSSTKAINLANLCFFTLWFFPFIHARTTAENFGMNVFALGLLVLVKSIPISTLKSSTNTLKINFLSNTKSIPLSHSLLGGFLIGMSVNFRIPLAPMPLFLCLWLLLIAQIKLSNVFVIVIGSFLSILFTSIFDTWGYEELTYSTWSYLYQEFTRNVSQGFGVSPWYYYITKVFSKGVPPLSIFMIIATVFVWIKKPTHLITWVSLPVFLLHSTIGHKELRYIFPLIIFVPILLALTFEHFEKTVLENRALKLTIRLSIILNLIFLLISSIKPAYTPIHIYKYLYNNGERINSLYTYNNLQRDILKIYLKKETPFIHITSENEVDHAVSKSENTSWFLVEKIKDFTTFEKRNCTQEYSTYPEWFTKKFSKQLQRSKAWAIYRCKK